jgi:hypothetical protein
MGIPLKTRYQVLREEEHEEEGHVHPDENRIMLF